MNISANNRSRIQIAKQAQILEAALEVFSTYGFRGSTLEQIAQQAGLSKPHILYYFSGKEVIHQQLIADLLDTWLAPLKEIKSTSEPVPALWSYIYTKLKMSYDMPRESRLFANEMLQGAPHIPAEIQNSLKELVDEKTVIIDGWIEQGLLAPHDPYHLLFSIWATTQHYADFGAQIQNLLPDSDSASPEQQQLQQFADAEKFLKHLYLSALTPKN